ncbi:MAG TPA: hypothetical protein VM598_14985, partial [Bdellovibrionota bacterium]|nr:hypothetical protein [Bdellovibrionota bacterium]
MDLLARAHRYWIALLCAGLGLIYGPLVRLDPVLERDDQKTLFFLKTWDQVVVLVREGRWQELVAFQLVKDASLWLDRWVSGAL